MGEETDVAELRRRLDMAEDELTFLKAVFEEYKDSSGELEAELDAQLKDLERSNIALKRENEQIRAQLQSTVSRSRKSAEEASNLTTALETHLEELTKREKKAQSKIRAMEQELADMKEANGGGDTRQWVPGSQLQQAKALTKEHEEGIANLKDVVVDVQKASYGMINLLGSRFSATHESHEVPKISIEDDDITGPIKVLQQELEDIREVLGKCDVLLHETKMSKLLVDKVGEMLNSDSAAQEAKLEGGSEQAINASCLVMLGKLMVLAAALPEYRAKSASLKTEVDVITQAEDDVALKAAPETAQKILEFCQDVTISVFEPLQESNRAAKAKEMEALKAEGLAMAEQARKDAEERMKKQMEAKMAELREKSSMDEKQLAEAREAEIAKEKERAQAEIDRLRVAQEEALASARTEARALAEKARLEALSEASVSRKAIEEEIYETVAGEMDKLRERLEESEKSYLQASRQQEMFQTSMKNAVTTQADRMKQAMKKASEEIIELKRSTQRELSETQKILNDNLNHVRKVARTIANSDIATLSMMYERELDMRVKLQDQVQALKGNIRVFCRIRPLLGGEIESGETEVVHKADNMTVKCVDPDSGKEQSFNFDRVFDPSASQEMVFDEMRTLCLSAMDGYNVCLFAYGITGSGKTYTVEGGEGPTGGTRGADEKLQGLVYRTIKEVFRIAFGERGGAYETSISVQLLECYNEEFRDLMTPDKKTVTVKLVGDDTKITGHSLHPVKSGIEALKVIQQGYGNRTVRGTSSNNVSSRSHSILTLHMKSENLRTKKVYQGQLHFVDLAGSERVAKSEVTGQAFEEAKAINKSLSALGDVISALSQKKDHVPFRNSSLTTLLKNSLGGNSKTVMISNISPCAHSMNETIASLRFATRVHKVEMGKASQASEDAEPSSKAKDIKNRMASLETKFTNKTSNMKPLNSARGRARSPMPPPGGVGGRQRSNTAGRR